MNANRNRSLVSRLFIVMVAALTAASAVTTTAAASTAGARAQADYYLKIEGTGYSKTVKVDEAGFNVTFDNLAAGEYTLTLVDNTGQPVDATGVFECVRSPRDAASGQATGRRAASSTQGDPVHGVDVKLGAQEAPRDAASGLATGKRQHAPVTVRNVITSGRPFQMKIAIDEPGKIQAKGSGVKIKTKSNIKND